MRRTANGRRVYTLADYTVERTRKGWYFGRTSRFGDMHAMKGPYSSERSLAVGGARIPAAYPPDQADHTARAQRASGRAVCHLG
jgi:hypothetical protein